MENLRAVIAYFKTYLIHHADVDDAAILQRHSGVRFKACAIDQRAVATALVLNEEYRPAERIWTSPPVRQFVAHIRRMGISGEAVEAPGAVDAAPVAEIPPVQTAAARTPRLSLPETELLPDASADDFLHAFDRALEKMDRSEPRK